ncbi:hypothetical protein SAMN05661096_01921 [Marivirga sericea]|uniref:Uncharacterized protein n=1 Tax=Marivirga sericea TaxID=1028 RepID=A0A1X7JPS4_9BACT|nr:hypothetical protein SAMN05661096_01921 [Marivirga sericea]
MSICNFQTFNKNHFPKLELNSIDTHEVQLIECKNFVIDLILKRK